MKPRLAYSADPAALRDPAPRRRGHLALAHSVPTLKRDPAEVQREQRAAFGLSLAFVRLRGAVSDGGAPKGPATALAAELIREMEIRNLLSDAFARIAITTPKPATA